MLPTLLSVTEEEVKAVADALRSVPLTTLFGEHEVEAFEAEFARLFGFRYAVAVTSGTTALLAALMAAEIGPGDEVIVTPFSFVASVSVVMQVGATPVFADIDPETFVLTAESIAAKMTPRTRAILPVHICGYPVDMNALQALTRGTGVLLIEDCAAAHGARVEGRAVGGFGDFGCFSFNIGKIMRTGEGGMVVAKDEEMHHRLRAIRVNGLVPAGNGTHVERLGTNFTMMQAVAALGRVQVRNFEWLSGRRRQIGELLRRDIAGLSVRLPSDRPSLERVYYSMPFLLPPELADRRDEIVDELRELNVPFSKGNKQLLHHVDYIRRVVPDASCPVAESVHPRLFYFDPLPCYDDEQAAGVARALRAVLGRYAHVAAGVQ
jgi:dTDP-4-amino-4,6-dideoxygalactose transaminase